MNPTVIEGDMMVYYDKVFRGDLIVKGDLVSKVLSTGFCPTRIKPFLRVTGNLVVEGRIDIGSIYADSIKCNSIDATHIFAREMSVNGMLRAWDVEVKKLSAVEIIAETITSSVLDIKLWLHAEEMQVDKIIVEDLKLADKILANSNHKCKSAECRGKEYGSSKDKE